MESATEPAEHSRISKQRPAIVAALTLALIFRVQTSDLPWPIVSAALLPSLVFLSLLWRIAGASWPPLSVTVATFLSGAVLAGIPAAHANQWLADLLRTMRPHDADGIARTAIAPVVEETAKALVLLATWWSFRKPADMRAATVRAAQVGLGFSLIENTQYLLLAAIQGGWSRLPLVLYLRGVLGGGQHALFVATTALGLFLASRTTATRAWRPLLIASSWAIAQHIAWNEVAAPWVAYELCDAPTAAAMCRSVPSALDLLVVAPLIVVGALAPGILVMAQVLRRNRRAPGASS